MNHTIKQAMKQGRSLLSFASGTWLAMMVAVTATTLCNAQDSSLMHAPIPESRPGVAYGQPYADNPPVMIDRASWTYQPAPPVRTFQKNDLVTIRVDEITRVMADGAANQRKQTLYEAILTDWIKLTQGQLRPIPNPTATPPWRPNRTRTTELNRRSSRVNC